VAVLAGGRSSEHQVSLRSASAVLDGLEAGRHDTVPVVIDRDGRWMEEDPRRLLAGDGPPEPPPLAIAPGLGLLGADVAFPVLHGPFGEDGTVQGLLESAGVPYVGAGVLASALCLDKGAFKRMMGAAGLPQVRYEIVTQVEWSSGRDAAVERAAAVGLPSFVKPAHLGSSVGISRVGGRDQLERALELALAHDPTALVEAAAIGLEVECSVIGNDRPVVSEPGEVVSVTGEWYDFESKYTAGGMELRVPAGIEPAQRDRVRRIATEAFRESGCAGLARVDFFVTDDGRVLLNELNTMPGFTETSVFAKLFAASGLPYVELLDRLLTLALERHEQAAEYLY
jgi:D-alanine-D-alanine ligase